MPEQEDVLMAPGDRLRSLRKEAGLTRDGLAQKAGVSYASICSYEYNVRRPSQLLAAKVATALGADPEFIWPKHELSSARDDFLVADSPGERVRAARRMKGLSQQELAREIGCTQAMISIWELNRNTARPRTKWKIAKALGLEVKEIWLDEPESRYNPVEVALFEQDLFLSDLATRLNIPRRTLDTYRQKSWRHVSWSRRQQIAGVLGLPVEKLWAPSSIDWGRMPPAMTGARLRYIRLGLGLTLTELAKAVGVSGERIRQLEYTASWPEPPRLAAKIAETLGVSLDELLGEKE